MLSAALQQLAEGEPGGLTVKALAARTGASTGSIYHRFESIDALIGELWTRTVIHFQDGFVASLQGDDSLEAGVRAAVHTPRWSRAHPAEAALLLTRNRGELVRELPQELGQRLTEVHERTAKALRTFSRRHFGSRSRTARETTRFALVDVPYAVTRRNILEGHPPPEFVDELVARTARALL